MRANDDIVDVDRSGNTDGMASIHCQVQPLRIRRVKCHHWQRLVEVGLNRRKVEGELSPIGEVEPHGVLQIAPHDAREEQVPRMRAKPRARPAGRR